MALHEEHLGRVAPEVVAAPTPAVGLPPTLARLAAAETAARAEHIRSCDAAAAPALARDLCLMAASEAQHAVVLSDLRRRARDS
jgi:hypothetical protein